MSKVNCVYVSGVFDLMHVGHVTILMKAASLGKTLIVGVSTDEDVETYKRKPIQSYSYRLEVVKSLPFVDKVITSPLFSSEQFYKFYNIDIHVQGEDCTNPLNYYKEGKRLGIMRFLGRHPFVSTTQMIYDVTSNVKIKNLFGISNSVYLLDIAGAKYVFKELDSNIIDADILSSDMILLEKSGFKTFNPVKISENIIRLDYFDGINYSIEEFNLTHCLIEKLEQLHNAGIVFNRNIIEMAEKLGRKDDLLDVISYLSCNYGLVPSHCDIHAGNIMLDKLSGDIVIIDWDFACMAPPYY